MRSTLALSVAAVAGIAAAQSSTQSNYPYTIDPNSVPSSTRGMCKLHLYLWSMTDFAIDYWCQQNEAQCPLICLQQPGVTSSTTQDNECDSVSLPNSLFGHEKCGDRVSLWTGGVQLDLTAIGQPFSRSPTVPTFPQNPC